MDFVTLHDSFRDYCSDNAECVLENKHLFCIILDFIVAATCAAQDEERKRSAGAVADAAEESARYALFQVLNLWHAPSADTRIDRPYFLGTPPPAAGG